MKWEIIPGKKNELNECLDCGHTSENWAERVASKDNEKDIVEEDGCNKVFCPKCKYEHYYCK
jgi:hypothetical protein